MPITLPKIDDRRYDDLVSEALARIPVHTPEWTNFNQSDPGVTLIGVFAFLTESLLYRANLIPERLRKKFLQLLRIPLRGATPAAGLVAISNEAPSADPQPIVLSSGLEVRAGKVPFRTARALDVLPVEGRLYVKKKLPAPSPELLDYYSQLYASYRGDVPDFPVELYETTPFPTREGAPLSLDDTTDGSLWLALLVREPDAASVTTAQLLKAIANRTLTLGVVPALPAAETTVLAPGRPFGSRSTLTLNAFAPKLDASGGLPTDGSERTPEYRPLETRADVDVFSVTGTIDIALPDESSMRLWNNLDPLEPGVDALPPQVDDDGVASRIATWIRLTPSAVTNTLFVWMGINAVAVTQRARVTGELLPPGTGEPDQTVRLARAPVLPETVELTVAAPHEEPRRWVMVDDLASASPEVPLPDPARTAVRARAASPHVFVLDPESGEIRFGDGMHGARPPEDAVIRATYDYAVGAEGNVGAGAINTSPALPAGFKVSNPIATRGGADAESVAEGEKQISRYLQNRNRLVTASDFATLALRTPGVDIARVEVLPNFRPSSGTEAPGVVTLMLIPASDPEQPDAPLPRAPFIEAVCRHLDPRRLVTTEILLRGPIYRGIWISIGVKVAAGFNESQVNDAVKQDVTRFLAPFAGGREVLPDADTVVLGSPTPRTNGWKLGKSVVSAELLAVANRTRGVEFANEVLLANTDGTLFPQIEMNGLDLPRVLGIRVTNGPAAPIGDLIGGSGSAIGGGQSGGSGGGTAPKSIKVPAVPEECRC